MPTIEGLAFAKINLGLRVLDRRADGFHELRTVFQSISLSDRVRVRHRPRARSGVRLSCSDRALEGPRNLAARAAEALLEGGPWKGRVEIELEKRIPAGAGLGGGSSDAAAVLLALERLLKPAPTSHHLWDAAARVGSDVPFFLTGGRAVGVGRGEEIYPLPEPSRAQWLLLVAPALHVSTVEAYGLLADARLSALTSGRKRLSMGSFCSGIRAPGGGLAADFAEFLANDFEEVIFDRFPELRDWKKRLLSAGASGASMSGSGSAVFGLFGDRLQAQRARKRLGEAAAGLFLLRTVGRREYRRVWKLVAE